jgi:hypothetical protein
MYKNSTSKFQIFTCNGLERIVNPNSIVYFEAHPHDVVHILDGIVTAIEADRILCDELIIN